MKETKFSKGMFFDWLLHHDLDNPMVNRSRLHLILSISANRNMDKDGIRTETIQRTSINPSGTLGSYYDATRDVIRGKLIGCFTSASATTPEQLSCRYLKDLPSGYQSMLDAMTMDDEQRLSIYLNLIPSAGTASLIGYAEPITEFTRLIFFDRITSVESLTDDLQIMPELLESSSYEIFATHMITKVHRGISVILVLQLSPDCHKEVDNLLTEMCDSRQSKQSAIEITSAQKDLYQKISSTTVYSNIPELRALTDFNDAYQRMLSLNSNLTEHQRVTYTMIPLSAIHLPDNVKCLNYSPTSSTTIAHLKQYLPHLVSQLTLLCVRVQQIESKLPCGKIQDELKEVKQQWRQIQQLYRDRLTQLRQAVVMVRRKESNHVEDFGDAIDEPVRELSATLELLENKLKFISDLEQNKVAYCDVTELGIKKGYGDQLVRDILRQEYSNKTIVCANDSLRISDATEWGQHYSQFVETASTDGDFNFVFADFTYSTCELKRIATIEPRHAIMEENLPKPKPPADPYINILLLGESGVGKSTFINAFANYLRFETLEDAEKHEPSVVIPVSFIMTSGTDFHEHVVQFGDPDSNEAHNKTGQSVTQRCQCYVLDLADGRKLRLIDTPGFGDSRGADQDELNMSEIFAFTHSLPSLSGICLLLKPNVNKLHAYFRSCFNQLLNFFGPTIREHLIFCFTNARSTFFAPGDTKPMLTTFFQSLSIEAITIHKENTFCFDSESFRYLVALKNSVIFNQLERKEFERSWLQSAGETKRFRHRLLQQKTFRQCEIWQSDIHARLQIRWLVRPICEGIRNLLRNILLYEKQQSIKLRAKPLKKPKMICYECSRDLEQYGPLCILADCLHNPTNTVSFEFLSFITSRQLLCSVPFPSRSDF